MLVHIADNRHREACKSVTFRHPMRTVCLKKANLRQSSSRYHTGPYRIPKTKREDKDAI